MAFTDYCDLYAAVHEIGVNKVIRHVMRQRPSLFNYATEDVAHNPELWCVAPVDCTNDVTKYGNPVFTIVDPIPLLGADSPVVTLGLCAQLVRAELDFFPGNAFPLPPELDPLEKQHFALHFNICGALGCVADDIDQMPLPTPGTPVMTHKEEPTSGPPVHFTGKLNCFCLDVYVVGHYERVNVGSTPALLGKVDNIEIVDIKPEGLEDNIECYVKSAVNAILRQKLLVAFSTLFYDFELLHLVTVSVAPTALSPKVPYNPAIEDDQLKAFITMTVN
jgi:hypothetical protein